MKVEDIWLLRFGRGWIPWYELADVTKEDVDPLLERMHEAGLLETDHNLLCVRLKPKEETV